MIENIDAERAVLSVKISLPGATRRASKSEVGMDGTDDEVFTRPGKYFMDKKALKPLRDKKAEVSRYLRSVGCGEWLDSNAKLVHPDTLDEAGRRLTELQAEWDVLVEQFCEQYLKVVERWQQEHPGCHLGQDHAPSLMDIRRACGFRWNAYHYRPAEISKVSIGGRPSSQEQVTEDLQQGLFESLAKKGKEVLDSFKQHAKKGTKVTRKAIRPLVRIANECRQRAFIDGDLIHVARQLEELVNRMPDRTRNFGNTHRLALLAAGKCLADPVQVRRALENEEPLIDDGIIVSLGGEPYDYGADDDGPLSPDIEKDSLEGGQDAEVQDPKVTDCAEVEVDTPSGQLVLTGAPSEDEEISWAEL